MNAPETQPVKAAVVVSSSKDDYNAVISNAAAGKLDVDISNASSEHAKIGITHLLANATGKVRLITTEFFYDFWEDLMPQLMAFLNNSPSSTLDIILLRPPEKSDQLLSTLVSTGRTQLQMVNSGTKPPASRKSKDDKLPNFLSLDDVGFRFELADDDLENGRAKGIINFGNRTSTKILNDYFDALKRDCVTYSIAAA